MITSKKIGEQMIGLFQEGKRKPRKALLVCSCELSVLEQQYLNCVNFSPVEETADYCLLVMKPLRQGGRFYDVEFPNQVHGLFQALSEVELLYQIERLHTYNIIEKNDIPVTIRLTDISTVVTSILYYSKEDCEWWASLTEYEATKYGREFSSERKMSVFNYLEVIHPGGFREVF